MFQRRSLALTLVATGGLALVSPSTGASASTPPASGPVIGHSLRTSDFPTDPFIWNRDPSVANSQTCFDAPVTWTGAFMRRGYSNAGYGTAVQVNGQAPSRAAAANLVDAANHQVHQCLVENDPLEWSPGPVRRTATSFGAGSVRIFNVYCPAGNDACSPSTHVVGIARVGHRVVHINVDLPRDSHRFSISAAEARALANLAVRRAVEG